MKEFDTEWLGITTPDNELFNPMDFVFSDSDVQNIIQRLLYVMSKPEYFYFTAKYILNVELLPFQLVVLKELWDKKYPMFIASRGASKSFTTAVYCILRCLLLPERKVVVVGSAFRQSKVIFEYMENIWKHAPILRDLCDNDSGPSRAVDSCVLRINRGKITCLPLGDGQKIRGQRAHDIIADEFASIPREIFENVVSGFGTVASNLVEKVKIECRKALNITKDTDQITLDAEKGNQIVLLGTAYYEFNHFADTWKKYRSYINTKGDRRKLEEVLGGEISKGFNWDDYVVMRVPVDKLPPGMMDDGIVARAKATVHAGIYNMEYGAIFTSDSEGFFRRTLIESCVLTKDNQIHLPSCGEVYFEAVLFGKADGRYIYGVDPASEVDHFSIVVLEVYDDHRRIVHCWTTNRQQHVQKVKTKMADETDFYSYCARKIRNLMKVFPCIEIAMDAGGGGIAVMEALHDKDKIQAGELAIWPVIDEEKEQPTDDNPGLHILRMCNFSKADWVSEANHGMRKDFEDKVLIFPFFDTLTLELSYKTDEIENRIYDTLEDCIMDIEELKNELSMIVISTTPGSNRERWDTPEIKLGTGKKTRLRKDRYSALLIANMSARTKYPQNILKGYGEIGGFAAKSLKEHSDKTKDMYMGPAWFTESLDDGLYD